MENLTEPERQLIECLREAADFKEWRLVVGYDELDGWEIALSCDGKKVSARLSPPHGTTSPACLWTTRANAPLMRP
jgi:hypothetical protein